MNKTQKFLRFITGDLGFFLILFIIIILSFILLSPKISAELFSFKRQVILNEFIAKTKANGIDPREYWKFREFYSPGYFTFSRTGIESAKLTETQKEIGVKYNGKNIDLTFLVFTSPKVKSLDMLTKEMDLSKIIDQKKLPQSNIVFINKTGIIYRDGPNILKSVFLFSNSEMKKANGFFDYSERDKMLTAGENWFNVTSITTK